MKQKVSNASSALVIAVLALYLMPNVSFVANPMLGALQSDVYPVLTNGSVAIL